MTPDDAPDDRTSLLLQDRVRRVFGELPGAVAGQEEPVHQVRVAGRRLRVSLPLLARKGQGRRVRRALKVLRQLTRTVGAGRDMDVILGLFDDRLAALRAPSAEQRALLSRLRSARARSRAQVADGVLDLDIDGLRRDLRRLLQGGASGSATVLARARAVREEEGAELLRGFSQVGERYRPEALHALRRRVRRLRYAAEVEDVVRGDESRAPVLWKRLQDGIGVIHDHHVLASLVRGAGPGRRGTRRRAARPRRAARAFGLRRASGGCCTGRSWRRSPQTSPCGPCRRWPAAGGSRPRIHDAEGPPMQLIIIRHAIAVPRGTPGIPDEDRPLTPEGEQKFREAAKGLASLVGRPDALLTSPWLRAKQTAAIAAAAWGRIEPKETAALASGSFEEQAAVLDRYPDDAIVAVVGHEPWVSELLARLLGSRHDDRLEFKKGGAALVDVPGRLAEGGQLVWYLPPKVLRKL